jgi:hypothetical protein
VRANTLKLLLTMAPEKTMILFFFFLTDQIHKLQDKIRTPFELRTFSLPKVDAVHKHLMSREKA